MKICAWPKKFKIWKLLWKVEGGEAPKRVLKEFEFEVYPAGWLLCPCTGAISRVADTTA